MSPPSQEIYVVGICFSEALFVGLEKLLRPLCKNIHLVSNSKIKFAAKIV